MNSNPDDLISRALAALAAAPPPDGLEHRILQSVEAHAPGERTGRRLLLNSPLAWGTALASLAMMVLLGLHGLRRVPDAAVAKLAAEAQAVRPQAVSPEAMWPRPVRSAAARPSPRMPVASAPTARSFRPELHAATSAAELRQSSRYVRSSDQRPLAALQSSAGSPVTDLAAAAGGDAPSPPAPLTAQERLLLRIAHRPSAIVLSSEMEPIPAEGSATVPPAAETPANSLFAGLRAGLFAGMTTGDPQ